MENRELLELEQLLRKLYGEIGVMIDAHAHLDAIITFIDGHIDTYNCKLKGKVMRRKENGR